MHHHHANKERRKDIVQINLFRENFVLALDLEK